MDLNMKVNHLPALTYRFLKSNEGQIDVKDLYIENTKTPEPENVPASVNVKADATEADVKGLFSGVNAKIKEKLVDLPGPNGDTAPLNDAQTVRTGMGVEIDKLMAEMNVPVTVITASEGEKIEQPVVIRYSLKDGECALGSQVIHAKKDS